MFQTHMQTLQFFQKLTSLFMLFFALGIHQATAQDGQTLKVSFSKDANQPINIDLLIGQSKIIELDDVHDTVQYSVPNVINVQPLSSNLLVINATALGQVNLVVLKDKGASNEARQILVFNIFVQKNLTLIDNQIKIHYPKENIQLSQVNDAVVISGSVTDPAIADHVEKMVKLSEGEKGEARVLNLLKKPISTTAQVELQVRIAEVNRSVAREVGTAFGILNSNVPAFIQSGLSKPTTNIASAAAGSVLRLSGDVTNIFLGTADRTAAFINALQTRGAIKTLAEPNISALNGKQGKFHSGGRKPIPQTFGNAGGGGIAVTFQEYGVRLEFTPTIIDENHIQIALNTEVSSIDPNANLAIAIEGNRVPGFRINSATTYIELADGQSFAIAGLLDNSESISLSQIPGIGNIPILGELFKSRSFQRNETELMFLCTVKLKEPLNPDQIPRLPGEPPARVSGQSGAKNDTSIAPLLNAAPTIPNVNVQPIAVGLLEGKSGHDVPAKTSTPTKSTAKIDQ